MTSTSGTTVRLTSGLPADTKTLGEQYDEALDVITGLWSGEPVTYNGTHYTIDDAVMHPTPVQEPRIPIVTGGFWPNKKPIQQGALGWNHAVVARHPWP